MTRRRLEERVLPLGLALAYFGLARLGLEFTDPWSHVAALWPASGIAVGVFAVIRPTQWRRLTAAVFVGALAAQISFHGLTSTNAGLAGVDALEPVLVASVLRVVGGAETAGLHTIRRAQGLLAGVAGDALLGAIGSALAAPGAFGRGFIIWWLSSAVAIVLIAPLVMAVVERPTRLRSRPRLEPVAMVATVGVLSWIVFTGSPARPVLGYQFVLLPPMVWGVLRTGNRASGVALAVVGAVAGWGTAHGHGPFATAMLSHRGRMETVQVFLVLSGAMYLVVAGLVQERRASRVAVAALAQELDTLMNSTEEAIYGVDAEGCITFVNRAAEAQTGYTREQMLGRNAHDLLHHTREDGTPYPRSECPVSHVRTSGEACRGADELFWRADGTSYPIEYSSSPLLEGDRVVGAVVTVADITERKRAEQQLAAAEARFHRAFSGAPVGILFVSLDATVLDVNDAYCELLNRPRDQLLGQPVRQLMHPDDYPVCIEAVRGILDGRCESVRLEMRYLSPDGQLVTGLTQTTLVHNPDGTPEHFVTHVLDITERKEFEAQLQHLTDHDPLTGLLNRRRFEIELAVYLSQGPAAHAPGAVLVLDIDDFKQINDTLGHSAGDELIAAVADILRTNLRDTDVLARLGGDEFAVLLPNTRRSEAEAVAAKLIVAVKQVARVPAGDRLRSVSISAGVTEFHAHDGLCADEVIVDADLAMYDAKDAGRGGFAFFAHSQESESRTKARMTWVDRIERAIEEGGFVLEAQPILDLRANEITHFELLLRMLDEHGDRIPPGAFLEVAERNGLMPRIDRWVVGEATRLLAEADRDGEQRRFEVNLSGHSIGDRELLEAITADIRDSKIDPSNLIFEITETVAVADIGRARRFADALSELGCRFALDDFGAGFGSFYYLKHLPFDYLKIDGEFVRGCAKSRTDRLVIEAVVQIAQGLGKETVAEFVIDAATRRVVQRLGVDFAQGAYVSMPLPLDQALELARHT
jgi:diguanylate cyclase (GGDEF)-like protein/PAS domain S-box-containing protein